jgi:hypothetical protein
MTMIDRQLAVLETKARLLVSPTNGLRHLKQV